mgnify:FL=1
MSVAPEKHKYKNFTYKQISEDHTRPAARRGKVTKLNYPTRRYGVKYAYVYTPYGYDGSDMKTRYDIVYIMHGANSGAETFLWGEGLDSHFKNILDHMIENGEIKPLIVVTPGLYPTSDVKNYKGQEAELADEFTDELVDHLMPAVESMYLTYADTIDAAGFRASRAHRAFGGFSMGAVVAWYTFARHMDLFSAFMPICGDCWIKGKFGGEHFPDETAEWLAGSVKNGPLTPDNFTIYMATGTLDMAFPGLTNQLGGMKKYPDVFHIVENGELVYDEDPAAAVPATGKAAQPNLYYFTVEGGVHDYVYAYEYFRAALAAEYPL